MRKSNFLFGAFIVIASMSPVYSADGVTDIFGGIVDTVKSTAQTLGNKLDNSNISSESKEITASDGFKYKSIDWWDGNAYSVRWNKKLNKYYCPNTQEFNNYSLTNKTIVTINEDEAIARGIPSSNGKDCHENYGLVDPNRSLPSNKKTDKSFSEIDLSDLKAEISSMNGKKVSVAGVIPRASDPFIFLGVKKLDSSAVLVTINNLSKEDKKILFKKCNEGCDIRVNGKVEVKEGAGSLVAEKIFTD